MRRKDSEAGEDTLLAPDLATEDALGEGRRRHDPHERPPARLGHYVLLDKLGAGAMGVVHAAYDTKLDRKVAIKLLQRRGSDRARRRLIREAQAMARLSHPNIVQIYEIGEGGENPEALAFIVMEFVDGITLRQWFTKQRRSRAEVLEVMRAAGRGLVAAHASGLVHRDFKPDNVMVRSDGRVLVMDFGLARGDFGDPHERDEESLSSAESGQYSELSHNLTATGAIVGTPAYMAPEQFHGKQADARTDQFSFCVTVWEALYRQRPFAGPSMAELSRAVTSGQLSTPPRGEVPGWLRAVLTRGLAVEPDDRWPSMQALLDALARDPTRRRWTMLGIGSAVGLIGAAILGITLHRNHQRAAQISSCEAEGRAIDEVWNPSRRAELEQRFLVFALDRSFAASAWAHAVPRMDAYAREWAELRIDACLDTSVDPHARELVIDCLDERRETFAGVVAAWAEADQRTIVGASMAAAGLPPLSMCRDRTWLAQRKSAPTELADAVAKLRARIERAHGLQLAGQYELALAEARRVEVEASKLAWPPLTAEVNLQIGRLHKNLGKFEDARVALEEAVFESLGAAHDMVALAAASALTGVVGHDLAQHEPGQRWRRLAMELIERLELAGSQQEAELLAFNSKLLYSQGLHEQALVELERALSIREQALGPDHLLVATVLNQIGNSHWELGNHARALAAHRRALTIREQALGPEHPAIAGSWNNIGLVLWDSGEYEQALAAHRRSLAINQATFGPDHFDSGTSHNNIGLVLWSQGALTQALESFAEALRIWEAELGPEHPDIALVHGNVGLILAEQGQLDAALAAHRRSLQIREATLGPDHQAVGLSHNNIGLVLQGQGQLDAALESFQRALAIYEATFGPEHRDVARALGNIGGLLHLQGKLEEGRELQQRSLAIREAALGPDHTDVALSLYALAEYDIATGDDSSARARLERVVSIQSKAKGDVGRQHEAMFQLAQVLWRLGEPKAAREQARASIEVLGEGGPEQVRAVEEWLRSH